MTPRLRYVVQEHFTDPHHFDLMFERDGKLTTWSIAEFQPLLQGKAVTARNIFDHRLKYLDYEGEIPGKGSVKIVTQGEYEAGSSAANHEFRILSGALAGRLTLTRDQSVSATEIWMVRWNPA